ncbi:MAG TPA: ABC transporter ATP-binding protein [Opitutales bacterium]|nr:ABC transporter ATP-binding protein [Opitutales bacterium]
MNLHLSQIVKNFGSQTVLDHIDLTVESGELFFLLGPSGCGKTTLLRIIAGFLDPDQGDIHFNKKRMNPISAHKRNTALVFQNYALWPHLSVFENVAYGLRVRKLRGQELQTEVETALKRVKMSAFSNRKPTTLSGGQQQRVALARALVVNPDLLLFDEPLSNLDAQLRTEMRAEIKRLHGENPITSLYVTHDQEEALSLADRIAVMREGKIEQVGTPMEIYTQPANRFVASFIGEINFVASDSSLRNFFPGTKNETCAFRPEHVRISPDGIPATVRFSAYLGSQNELLLETADGEMIKARVSEFIPEGTALYFQVDEQHLLRFPEETGDSR